jgi:PAS domain S-box-containing protein
MITIQLIYNLSLLVALSIVSGFIDKRFPHKSVTGVIMQGLLFGAVAIVGMLYPFVLTPGLIFDGRSVVLSLSALFFGPVAGTIAGIMALTFRFFQGGIGIIPGALVIFSSVLIGTIYHEYRKFINEKITVLQLLFFGIVVHIVMLLCMFSLPFSEAISTIQRIGLSVIIVFPLATVLIGKILSYQQTTEEVEKIISKSERTLKESEEFLKETQLIARLGTYDLDITTGLWKSSEIMDSVLGIDVNFVKSVEGWISLLHPGWKEIMSDYFLNEVIGKGNNFDKEYKIIRKKDGEERWVHGMGKLSFNNDNKPVRMVGTIRDITDRKNVEEELRKSRDELQDYFENDISADYVTTLDGKLIDCNKTFLELFGIPDKGQLGKINVTNYFKNPLSRKELIEEIKKNKRVSNYEVEFVLPDKKVLSALLMMVGVFSDSGELQKIRGYIVDITDKKKAEEGYRKLSLAVDQSPASVVITNPAGEIEYVNEKFCDVTGYSKEEVLGKNPRILKSGNQGSEFYENLWVTILAGREWSGELQNKKKNGDLYWEYAQISPLTNKEGDIISFIAVKEDITERKREQEELIKAKENAEEMNRLKNIFLSNMSHELRTPLIGILGYAEYLSEELQETRLIEMVDIIRSSGKRLNETLNNILDISVIESEKRKVNLRKQDLLKYLNEQIVLFRPVAKRKNLILVLRTDEEKIEAYIDEELFISIINNLLSNALKYTEKGSVIISARKDLDKAVVEVKDTGIGIPEEYSEVIFEPFRQVSEGWNRKYEGTGLGLTLVKKFTGLLGASVSLKSAPDEGSTFTIEFSVNQPQDFPVINTKW